jgi:ABC-type uncharacterized transport system permease subunit
LTKIIVSGTLLATVALLITGSIFPIYPISWLASTSIEFGILRVALAALLVALLITKPPREMYFRYMLGAAALVTFSVATVLMFQFKLAILDFMILSLAATNFALAALEPDPAKEPAKQTPSLARFKKARAKYIKVNG